MSKQKEFEPKKYAKNGLSEEDVLEIKEVFDLFDSDKSGAIDHNEFKKAFSDLGIESKNQTLDIMIKEIDKNKSGDIDFQEFIDMVNSKPSEKYTRKDLEKVFNLFVGYDDSQKIEFKHLQKIIKELELDKNYSDEVLQQIINCADKDNDGKVSFEEYYQIMTM